MYPNRIDQLQKKYLDENSLVRTRPIVMAVMLNPLLISMITHIRQYSITIWI